MWPAWCAYAAFVIINIPLLIPEKGTLYASCGPQRHFFSLCGPWARFCSKCGPHTELSLRPLFWEVVSMWIDPNDWMKKLTGLWRWKQLGFLASLRPESTTLSSKDPPRSFLQLFESSLGSYITQAIFWSWHFDKERKNISQKSVVWKSIAKHTAVIYEMSF